MAAEIESVERQLWCCVIQQAWDDFRAPKPSWRQAANEWARDFREAQLFLTKRTGMWAQSREQICRMAGIDPDDLLKRALAEGPGA